MNVEDLVRLLKAAHGKVVKGDLPGVRKARRKP
jgi:hypothetical protein